MEKIAFFGCPLDCDERHESLQEKLSLLNQGEKIASPYETLIDLLRSDLDPNLWLEKGNLTIPTWLEPIPPGGEKEKLTAGEMVRFLDEDGCRDMADQVGAFVKEQIFPHLPVLIGVDHSLTGGVYRRVAERFAPGDVALVVLDSHTDAIPMSVLAPAVQYDAATNPESVHDPEDPLLYDRPDSYQASSFLYHLLIEGIVSPRNLFVLGISDYPPKHAFRLKDERIRNYVRFYQELKTSGVTLVTKEELASSPSRIRRILEAIKTPYLYISVDMDIGARNALEGVRFLDRQGLSEPQLFRLIDHLKAVLKKGIKLAGLDLTEFNPRSPGRESTYRIAAEIIKKLLVVSALSS
ncbi:MAG: arginase family protein [Deltaproteobacteria bacterium]|nr:arginase family protein [Deltaproteobacteria bacterium]